MNRKPIIAACVALLTVFASGCGVDKESAIETSREWARLAPLPVSNSDVNVETIGSIFTREFRLSFRVQPGNLDSWLQSCEGIADAEIYQEGTHVRYAIRPGGGAMFAELRVNRSTGEVFIRTYWS